MVPDVCGSIQSSLATGGYLNLIEIEWSKKFSSWLTSQVLSGLTGLAAPIWYSTDVEYASHPRKSCGIVRVWILSRRAAPFFLNIYLFIGLPWVLVAACGIFSCGTRALSCGTRALSCGMRDLVPWPGIEPGSPASGVRSLNCWTTREAPAPFFLAAGEYFLETTAPDVISQDLLLQCSFVLVQVWVSL